MMLPIVIGSTLKGTLTGLAAGLVARSRSSMLLRVLTGVIVGFVLSSLAAFGQGDHYFEIVMPGMVLGALVGFVTQRYPHGSVTVRTLAAALALACAAPALAQPVTPEPFAPIASLVGKWTGTTEGQPGAGTVEREYERVMGGRFIRVKNRSTYPPQAKNPKGENHEDAGFFSFDRARKRLVLRQFHVEGFVNTYAQELESKPGTVVFVTEGIENVPAGYRARETYIVHSPDDIEEVFELAETGKAFELLSRTRLKRARQRSRPRHGSSDGASAGQPLGQVS